MRYYSNKRLVLTLLLLPWPVVLAVVIALDMSKQLNKPSGLSAFDPPSKTEETVKLIESLFSTNNIPTLAKAENVSNPFFVSQDKPKPAPPKEEEKPEQKPPPPPIVISYQGNLTTSMGENIAYVQVDEKLITVRLGDNVTKDYNVSEILTGNLVLTNQAGGKVEIPFNSNAEIQP
ncbi:MAG: hypothetical protein K9N48_02460 [Verrucomicrobia bacterium]|nr:hypothetical protein [Verrucomicrobiota bacterium]MCF7708859.1 hypothetical protein [Verrucomicrobiota bacterium]